MGNKNDCPEKKVVQTEDAQKFADQIGIQLYETSAKENLNVEEVSSSKFNVILLGSVLLRGHCINPHKCVKCWAH